MEEYINDDTVIEDEVYNEFKDFVTCSLCLCILKDPVMCMKCQNVFCRSCANDWAKKDDKCPNRCPNPNYQKCRAKNEILSKFKFKCPSCGLILKYNDTKEHKSKCCAELLQQYEIIDNFKETPTPSDEKIGRLSRDEIVKLNKNGNTVSYINSKIIFFK